MLGNEDEVLYHHNFYIILHLIYVDDVENVDVAKVAKL